MQLNTGELGVVIKVSPELQTKPVIKLSTDPEWGIAVREAGNRFNPAFDNGDPKDFMLGRDF